MHFTTFNFTFNQQSLYLHPLNALFWAEKNYLILADLHFGKITHFRRSGIPVPAKAFEQNIEKLNYLIQTYKPNAVIFLGDLFHSSYNLEWNYLQNIFNNNLNICFKLVKGNHDILPHDLYKIKNFEVIEHCLIIDPFVFSHQAIKDESIKEYNISGHIHPGIKIKGKGRQTLTLPCFYFGKNYSLLPAFGYFTGMHLIKPDKGDKVMATTDKKVFSIL